MSGERLQDHWSSGSFMKSFVFEQQVLFRVFSLLDLGP